MVIFLEKISAFISFYYFLKLPASDEEGYIAKYVRKSERRLCGDIGKLSKQKHELRERNRQG